MDALIAAASVGRAAFLLAVVAITAPLPASADPIWRAEEWTTIEGRGWTAGELEGRVVLLDFWATWCAPCLAELPTLRALHTRHGGEGLVVVGIALDATDRRRLRSFLRRHAIDWPQVHEPAGVDSEIARRFGVDAVPSTVLVDRRGRIVARDLRGEALAAVVGTLLDQFQ